MSFESAITVAFFFSFAAFFVGLLVYGANYNRREREALTSASLKHGWRYSEANQTLEGKTPEAFNWILKKVDEDLVWLVEGVVSDQCVNICKKAGTFVPDYSGRKMKWLLRLAYHPSEAEKLFSAREFLIGTAGFIKRYVVITTDPGAAHRLLTRKVDEMLTEWPEKPYRNVLPEVTLSTRSLKVRFESAFETDVIERIVALGTALMRAYYSK